MSDRSPVPGSRWAWALAYAPWAWLVVWLWLVVSTVAGAFIAVGLWRVKPDLAFGFGRLWSGAILRMNLSRVSITGVGKARPGQAYVIVSNHQSHLDVPSFWSRWPLPFRFVMKEELRRVPFFGFASRVLGMVFVDRKDHARAIASLQAARPLLDEGVSLLFFAEGTRSPDGRLRAFKKGAFALAMEAGLPILPVSISGTYRMLPGRHLSLLPGHARITIHDPIPTAGLEPGERDALIDRVHRVVGSALTPWERGEPVDP